MNDQTTGIIIGIGLFIAGIYLGIRYSSDESESITPHMWWLKACFRARQREEYKSYSTQLAKQNAYSKEESEHGL